MADQFTAAFRLRSSRSDVPPGFLSRQRLNAMLDKGSLKSVTSVCAGPGYGKTLAVSAWSRGGKLPGPVAWLTADDSYDVQGMWTDVLDALRLSDVSLSGPLREITPGTQFGTPELNRIVEALSQLPTPVVLVIDDFHNITDTAALASLSRVVERRIPQLRLVLVSRTEPALRLGRLRITDEVTDIDARDLAFTAAEARDVCALGGFAVPDDEMDRLQSRTQGWAAGLRLVLLSAGDIGSEVPGLDHFWGGNNRRLAQYLLEEILERLSPRDRLFLLATSVVDQMTAELARALSGRTDSSRVLESLVARNALTMRLSDRPNWFRYHPLLRELLQDRLAAENPAGVPELHSVAAIWFASVNEPILAIRHHALARDWTAVATLLGEVALPLILTPQATALVSALSAGNDSVPRRPTAETLLIAAVCDYQRHDFESMARKAEDAATLLEAGNDDGSLAYWAVIGLARMVHSRAAAPADLVGTSTSLMELSQHLRRQQIPAASGYELIATNNRASGLALEGAIDQAGSILSAVRTQGIHAGMDLMVMSATSYLALIDVVSGNLQQAADTSRGALDLAEMKGWGRELQVLASYAARALVCLQRNELDHAQRHIDAGLNSSEEGSDLGCRLILQFAAIGVANARGDLFGARDLLRRLDMMVAVVGDLPTLLAGWSLTVRADVELLASEPETVLALVRDPGDHAGYSSGLARIVRAKALLALARPTAAIESLGPAHRLAPFRAISAEGAVLEAVAYGRLRRETLAAERMADALELAEPISLRRPFMLKDAQVAIQLGRHIRFTDDHRDFVTELAILTGVVDEQPEPPPAVVQSLTERELAVLKYLPTMLKSSEIASDLFVSVNTVKTHQRSIYRKLGVTSRREAVESAHYWELL